MGGGLISRCFSARLRADARDLPYCACQDKLGLKPLPDDEGVVAGSLGYVLGLTSYRLMAIFGITLGVKQKVETIWGILALGLSLGAAILGTVIPAFKSSLIATPSLIRRWRVKLEEKPKTPGEPWRLRIPFRIQEKDLGKFFDFMDKQLQEYASYRLITNLKVRRKDVAEPKDIRLSFTYILSQEGLSATENEVFLEKSRLPKRYAIRLTSKTRRGVISREEELEVRRTASLIRRLILQYSTEQRAQEGEAL